MNNSIDINQWHPVGFSRDPLASRGWGTITEAVTNHPVTFEELVSRYNALLLDARERASNAEQGDRA